MRKHIQPKSRPKETHFQDEGFENCNVCIFKAGKRGTSQDIQTRQGNSVSSFCCIPLNQYQERPQADWVSPDGHTSGATEPTEPPGSQSIPNVETPRVIGALTRAPELSSAESSLLDTMRSSFSKFFNGESVPLETDPITEAFYNARYVDFVSPIQITTKASSMYGMTMSEVSAVNTWVKDYMISEDLVSGLVQTYPKPRLKEQVSDYVC